MTQNPPKTRTFFERKKYLIKRKIAHQTDEGSMRSASQERS